MEQLLTEILEIIESESADVFVPRRVQIRYCYPFAVGRELGPDDEISRRPEQLVKNDFDKALKCLGISAKEPEPLTATEFFTRGPGHYGAYGWNFRALASAISGIPTWLVWTVASICRTAGCGLI